MVARDNARGPRLHVVVGKGGVGKSTVAVGLALAEARRQKRVLVVELDRPAGCAQLLGCSPQRPGVSVSTQWGVDLAYFEGESALAEYLVSFFPLVRRFQGLFVHPLYRAFVEAGPGVKELFVLGKVRDELLGLRSERPRYDVLVFDAGASGHALQMLEMPISAARTFSRGPAHREAQRVAATFGDPRTTAVHVVALPEQMPLEEAKEVALRLTVGRHLPLGQVIVNGCRPPAPEGARDFVDELGDLGISAPLVAAARTELEWVERQERGISRLERSLGMRVLRLPKLSVLQLGRPELDRLSAVLGLGEP